MRTVVWVGLTLFVSAPAFADAPPTLEDAIAKATQARKPLVIEFFADWCKPCKYFDAQVLPRADVAAALKNVEFVRYDIDASPGGEIADKLNVSGVPTFLVIDGAGRVTARRSGMSMTNGHVFFLDLLAHAGRSTQSTEELEGAIAERPNDVSAHLKLAYHYRAIGRIHDASEQFGWIVDNASAHRALAAEAAAERDAMDDAEARLTAAVASAEKFAVTYPDSRLASFRIVALAQSGRLARSRVNELVKAHLDAVPLLQWPNALRAALLANAIALARESVELRMQQDPTNPLIQLVHAELLMFVGERSEAQRKIDAACRPPGRELWCYLLQQSMDSDREQSPQVIRLRDFAKGYLGALEQPEPRTDDYGIESISDVDESFGNAVAVAFRRAQLECNYASVLGGAAMVVLELRIVGPPMRVTVRSRDGDELNNCVRRVVQAVALPPAPPTIQGHLHGAITFPTWRKSSPLPPGWRGAGIMPQLLIRVGDVETYSARASAMVDIGGERTLRWMLGGTLEVGVSGPSSTYAARLLTGLGSVLMSPHTNISLVLGIGVSDLGKDAPRALELPSEVRVRINLGKTRLHLWLEGATIFLEKLRQPDVGHAALGLDEWGLGAGISFAIAKRRLYLAGAYEHRVPGTSAMMLLGVPVGNFY